ncbi:MAG TPA: carboxypeptidase-like regulatory domain-containing protein [Gemmatimonadaceae bacterium]|jgi:hypothetical protein
MRAFARTAAALVLLPVFHAAAQTATLSGAVVRDTLSHALAGATVLIPDLNRTATSDANGEFKITGLSAGRHAVLIRHIGFNSLVDTVIFVAGQSADREYVLDPTPTTLDSVRVNAAREPAHLTAGMSQFEDHRKLGLGHFVTEAELRMNDSRKLNDVLTAKIPGLSTYRPYPKTEPEVEYLSSGRGQSGISGSSFCPVTLYVNSVLYFAAGMRGSQIPDIARFATADLEGVEYYAGGAQVPEQYNATQAGCGVLVLWMRER